MHRWARRLIGVNRQAALAALEASKAEGEAQLAAKRQQLAKARQRIGALKEEMAQLGAQETELEAKAQELSTVLAQAEGHALDVLVSAVARHREEQDKLRQALRGVEERRRDNRHQRAQAANELFTLIERYLAALPQKPPVQQKEKSRPAGGMA